MKSETRNSKLKTGRDVLFVLIIGAVSAPLFVVLSSWLTPMDEIFIHLFRTDLTDVMGNTAWLLLGVAIGTTLLGVSLAWLTTTSDFPGRSLFDWAIILPLAIPTYVLAFIHLSLFDRTGPIQRFLISHGGSLLPSIRGTGGIIFVMTLTLYPYVYLFARNAFHTQGPRASEVARTLGYRKEVTFLKVALPMARPWIVGGLMLVLMETISDFGAVSVFNYDTMTTTIYKAWFSLFSLNAAAKFSSLLVLLVFSLILMEQKALQGRRYSTTERQPAPMIRTPLKGGQRLLAFGYCGMILLLSFILPVGVLIKETLIGWEKNFDSRFFGFLNHSFFLSATAALITTLSALALAYLGRASSAIQAHQSFKRLFMIKLATLGYAFPGAILAVGGIILVTFVDRQIREKLHLATGFFMTGTLLAMLLGYLSRFMALAYNPLESAMHRITPQIEEAAQSLGASPVRVLKKIQIPLLRSGMLTAGLLVFIDVMKEMPITLMTRPFGWDTLSVRIFQFTSEGEWDKAALPALTLVLLGLIPVIFLTRQSHFRT